MMNFAGSNRSVPQKSVSTEKSWRAVDRDEDRKILSFLVRMMTVDPSDRLCVRGDDVYVDTWYRYSGRMGRSTSHLFLGGSSRGEVVDTLSLHVTQLNRVVARCHSYLDFPPFRSSRTPDTPSANEEYYGNLRTQLLEAFPALEGVLAHMTVWYVDDDRVQSVLNDLIKKVKEAQKYLSNCGGWQSTQPATKIND